VDDRRLRFSDQLSLDYFGGLTSETFNPRTNRYEKKRSSPRNEPLDTWVYAYAAALHPELRLPQWTRAQWDARAAQLLASIGKRAVDSRETSTPADRHDQPHPLLQAPAKDSRETKRKRTAGGFVSRY
jgi:phage terminase large subunit GpA-like protein